MLSVADKVIEAVKSGAIKQINQGNQPFELHVNSNALQRFARKRFIQFNCWSHGNLRLNNYRFV